MRVNFLYHGEYVVEVKDRYAPGVDFSKMEFPLKIPDGLGVLWGLSGRMGSYNQLDNRIIIFKDFPILVQWLALIHEMVHYFITHFYSYSREEKHEDFDLLWGKLRGYLTRCPNWYRLGVEVRDEKFIL